MVPIAPIITGIYYYYYYYYYYCYCGPIKFCCRLHFVSITNICVQSTSKECFGTTSKVICRYCYGLYVYGLGEAPSIDQLSIFY